MSQEDVIQIDDFKWVDFGEFTDGLLIINFEKGYGKFTRIGVGKYRLQLGDSAVPRQPGFGVPINRLKVEFVSKQGTGADFSVGVDRTNSTPTQIDVQGFNSAGQAAEIQGTLIYSVLQNINNGQ